MNSITIHKNIRKHALQARARKDSGDAFIKDPQGGPARTKDELAETLAEQFIGSITGGQSSDGLDDVFSQDELGGPFITTRARREFALGADASNPPDAEPAPLPTVMSEGSSESDSEADEGDESPLRGA